MLFCSGSAQRHKNAFRMEGTHLVPGKDSIVIVLEFSSLAVINCIPELTDHVHVNIDVRTPLLRSLGASLETVRVEVGIVIVEARDGSSVQRSRHPLVTIVMDAIVLEESIVLGVGAIFAVVHLFLGSRAESTERTSVLVVGLDIVIVCVSFIVDRDLAPTLEASAFHLLRHGESADLAFNVIRGVIGDVVLNLNIRFSCRVILVHNPSHRVSIDGHRADGRPLGYSAGQSRVELDDGIGFGVSPVLVDPLGVSESLGGL
mmetsp:Transcript_6087/g.17799  ORF Transcript_6087/g.17799 Transcript_6087/m.17799 type:complete len:260 (-) Transcript_6087:286-1065(-)